MSRLAVALDTAQCCAKSAQSTGALAPSRSMNHRCLAFTVSFTVSFRVSFTVSSAEISDDLPLSAMAFGYKIMLPHLLCVRRLRLRYPAGCRSIIPRVALRSWRRYVGPHGLHQLLSTRDHGCRRVSDGCPSLRKNNTSDRHQSVYTPVVCAAMLSGVK